jgi:hypothetical protein
MHSSRIAPVHVRLWLQHENGAIITVQAPRVPPSDIAPGESACFSETVIFHFAVASDG